MPTLCLPPLLTIIIKGVFFFFDSINIFSTSSIVISFPHLVENSCLISFNSINVSGLILTVVLFTFSWPPPCTKCEGFSLWSMLWPPRITRCLRSLMLGWGWVGLWLRLSLLSRLRLERRSIGRSRLRKWGLFCLCWIWILLQLRQEARSSHTCRWDRGMWIHLAWRIVLYVGVKKCLPFFVGVRGYIRCGY